MMSNASGKHCRKGFTQAEFFRRFGNDEAAAQWFIQERWGDTPTCPHCGSANADMKAKHPNMPHRCRARCCRRHFSVKVGTSMECSNLGFRDWLYSSRMLPTNPALTS